MRRSPVEYGKYLHYTPYLFAYEMIILHTYEMKFPTLIL